MSIVLTDGNYYIRFSSGGAVRRTLNIKEARTFYNVNMASKKLLEKIKKHPEKCEGVYVFDTEGDEHTLSTPKRVTERKYYSKNVRKIIYDNADGRCALCGRKITYKDMTLDHVVPLAMGGADEVENLACTCFTCNQFKGSILPDDFMDRISQIYLYQMGKKIGEDSFKWKIIKRIVLRWK